MADLRCEQEWIEARLAGVHLAAVADDWARRRAPVAYVAGMVEVADALDRLGRAVGEPVRADADDPTELRRAFENVIVGMSYDLARGWVEDTDAAFGWALRWAAEHGAPAEWHTSVGKIMDVLDDLPEGDRDLGLLEVVMALSLRVEAPPVSGTGSAMPAVLERGWEYLVGLKQVLPAREVDRLEQAQHGAERRVMARP